MGKGLEKNTGDGIARMGLRNVAGEDRSVVVGGGCGRGKYMKGYVQKEG